MATGVKERDTSLHLEGLGVPSLNHIADVFQLSTTELAGLFGVRRQAVDQWQSAGVPAARQAKVATVAAVADLLIRQLKRDRIPGIARKPAKAYGGRTMLEMIAADGHAELLQQVHRSFDWASGS